MQTRTLIRARDLAAFREAVIDRALAGGPLEARSRAVVVPTRAAAELLRQSIEIRLGGGRAAGAILPDFVTRREFVERLGAAAPGVPRLVTTTAPWFAATPIDEDTRSGSGPMGVPNGSPFSSYSITTSPRSTYT